jgi:hypothetical protein
MTHLGNYNDNVIGFNQGTAFKPKAKYVPQVLCEKTLWTKQLKTLSPRLKELMTMLTYARPEGSDTEEAFITRFIDSLPNVTMDANGNRIVQIGKEAPTVCFTSHTDTVDYDEGEKAIELTSKGLIGLDWNSEASCLGADCTAGIWLMRRMILAGKKGLYIFHREEESGGRGSSFITANTPELVANIKVMISLDRKGYDSVITEQITGVTASKAFASSIALQLPAGMKADPTGSFTDSASYSHLIPECTNLSIGYHACHTIKETLNFRFTDVLLRHLIALDYSQIEVSRVPVPAYVDNCYYGPYTADAYDRWLQGENDAYYKSELDPADDPLTEGIKTDGSNHNTFYDHNLADLCRRYPEAAAILLGELGVSELDIYETNQGMKVRA